MTLRPSALLFILSLATLLVACPPPHGDDDDNHIAILGGGSHSVDDVILTEVASGSAWHASSVSRST